MAFFNSAVGVLQTLVVALGAGLGIWGAINLLEGRTTSGGRQLCADRSGAETGNDNPGAKSSPPGTTRFAWSQGMKQLMAGGGVALIGTTLVPLLSGLFG